MEISRIFGRPRNANGFIVVMLLPSSESFFKNRKPANASLLITGKLFLVSARFSTVGGSFLVGITVRLPLLHSTCESMKESNERFLCVCENTRIYFGVFF